MRMRPTSCADMRVQARLTDAVIVNTCAVTAEAEAKRGRRSAECGGSGPDARIVVTGCAAQISPERFAAMPEVDHVIGNAEKVRRETFQSLTGVTGSAPRVQVGNIMDARGAAVQHADIHGANLGTLGEPAARAFVEVQNGCDHRCTFCVIPFGRGPSRSVPGAEVVGARSPSGRARRAGGGADRGRHHRVGERLGRGAVARAHSCAVFCVRCRSLLVCGFRRSTRQRPMRTCWRRSPRKQRLMPHLHLSLQSGSDLILKRMKRRHSRAQAIAFCKEVRAAATRYRHRRGSDRRISDGNRAGIWPTPWT